MPSESVEGRVTSVDWGVKVRRLREDGPMQLDGEVAICEVVGKSDGEFWDPDSPDSMPERRCTRR